METLPQEYTGAGLDDFVIETRKYAGEITIEVKASNILEVCKVLKEKLGFIYLTDISGIDYYTDQKRFGIAYNIVNLETKKRVRILARVEEDKPELETVTTVWSSADWFEREAYDMMGIRFSNHPDLRRIFMPEDYEYFPLRKEFPLIGIPGSIQVPEKDPPKEYS